MKTSLQTITLTKSIFGAAWLFWTFSCLFLYCSESSEFKMKIYAIEKSKKGFLKLTETIGPTTRTSSKYLVGYIVEFQDTINTYKIMVTRRNKYFDKEAGDIVPIWYNETSHFLMERIYKTPQETIDFLDQEAQDEKWFYIKVSAVLFLIYVFLIFLENHLSK